MKRAKVSYSCYKRRIYLLAIVILCVSGLSLRSNTFPIHYNLNGLPRVENGEISIYKIPAGLSFVRETGLVFPEMKPATEIILDYEERKIKLQVNIGGITDIYPPVTMNMDNFYWQHYRKKFREGLFERSKELLAEKDRQNQKGLIGEFTFKLPKKAQKSKIVRGILGRKAGSLSLDGSEKVTIEGSSSTRNTAGNENNDSSDFDLNMRQELNLRLKGTIGEKIHVNVNHRSTSEDEILSNPSTVEINYEGTEDEIIKRIEGGNISLSLSGSQYISYTASSEGLFGVKSDLEVGDLDMTLILGKDEAQKESQKWQGTSQADSLTLESEDYDIHRFYYITDPEDLYILYGDPVYDAQLGENYPPTYEGNAIRTDAGKWLMRPGSEDILPEPGTLHVYFDDNTSNNQDLTTPGTNLYDDDDNEEYSFSELIEGTDFTFDYDMGLLYINRVIDKRHSLAVIYENEEGNVGYYSAEEQRLFVKVIKQSNQDYNENPEYWKLEARNIYKMRENYQSEGFELYVFDDTASDGTPTLNCPAEIGAGYAETYNDYLRLDTNGDGIINGEDEPVMLSSGYLTFAFLEPFAGLGDEVIYQKYPVSVLPDDIIMQITVKGKSDQDQITLGQWNILPGSVKVLLGEGATQRELKENVDYIVDYDFGIISFLTDEARDADAILNITYDYKSTFAVDNTTLAGIRADWEVNDNLSLGGTFIYHNETVKEDHPKIGGENMTLFLGDIDGELEYELPFLTRALDWLPLIKTDEDSRVTFSGEMAMSIPRIYGNSSNPNEAYIDDMEAILESYPLGVVRSGWVPASKPYNIDYAKATPNWFNAQNIYRKDVYNPESLTMEEENEEVPVLAIKLDPPDVHSPGMNNRYWGGVMKYVGNQIDFSNKKYIEVLVKVDSVTQNPKPIVMHVNLGAINEDFYTDFGGEGVLNTEDGANGGFTDGELDQYGSVNEDIGLDMVPDGEPGDDPKDNYDAEKVDDEYPWINGTEDNDRLDTEDLDNNGDLNMSDIYFEYSFILKDTMYLESEYNNWYLYRIPVDQKDDYNIISNSNLEPDLERISYARIWFETQEQAKIKLVNVDLIGNKWEENFIRDENDNIISIFDLENNRESMQVSVIDNQKNLHYTPAPGSVIKERNEETLEQSMFIDYKNLQPGHHGLVRQKFREKISLINYEKIRFWIYSEKFEGDNADLEHDLVIRIGKDSLYYYEVNYPLTASNYLAEMDKDKWIDLEIDFSELTYLKSPDSDDSSFVQVDNYYSYYEIDGKRIELHRTPTLSNIEEISIGIENNGEDEFNGRIYVNDIRVVNPYDDIGYATRGNFSLQMADFADFGADAEWKTDSFMNKADRKTSSGTSTSSTTSFNLSSNIKLHKFLPAQWGFNIPLTLSRTESRQQSRFKANSDILWEDMNDEDKEREKSHYLKYKADLSLKLNKTPNTAWKFWNGFVDYTAKAASLSGYIEKRWDKKPTTTDTTLAYQVKHSYKLNIPEDKVSFALWDRYRLGFFINSFNNTLTYKADLPEGRSWRWNTSGDSAYWEPQPNVVNQKTLTTSSSVKYDFLSDLSLEYGLKTTRDMLLDRDWNGYNIGTEKNRDQSIDVKYQPKYLSSIFSFNSSLNIDYDDKTRKKSYNSEDDDFYYEGGVKRDFTTNLTLKNKDLMNSFVNMVWTEQPERGSSEPEDKEGRRGEEEETTPAEDEEIREEEKSAEDDEVKNAEDGEEEISKPKRRINILKSVVEYVGGLENIQISYDNSYSTDYDELDERPSFEYQLGLPHVLRETDTVDSLTGETLEKEIQMRQDGNQISVSTGFPIWKNLTTQLSYDWQLTQKYTSSPTQTITVNFPNIRVQLNEFNTLIGIENILKSSSLSSSYAVNNKKTGVVDWDEPNTDETSINFSPLLSWSGNWVKDISSHININHRQTESITFSETGDIVRNETTQSASGDVAWSFSAEKGIKIPFTKKRFYIKNDTTLRLDASFDRSWTTRKGGDNPAQKEKDQTNFSIRPQVSYDFSDNITAGLTSEYSINNNIKNSNKINTFSLSIWVEIMF